MLRAQVRDRRLVSILEFGLVSSFLYIALQTVGLLHVEFGDWLASLTGEFSLDASLYAGQPNCRMSTNQLNLGFMVVVLGVYEIPQGNSHYILYVGSLIVLSSTKNQASVPLPAKLALYSPNSSVQQYNALSAIASPRFLLLLQLISNKFNR